MGSRLHPLPPRMPIPASAGIGFRAAHRQAFLTERQPVSWVEVHSENYFSAGGPAHATLTAVRADYALSLHGVGLSLGSADGLDRRHLEQLRDLVRRYEPALVSEHLSWGSIGGRHLNDLLPVPQTREALAQLISHVHEAQECIARPLLIENISSYVRFADPEMPEHELLVELARATGCYILLDVNNLYVNERNHGTSAGDYIDALPPELVREIHLGGHSLQRFGGTEILVDTHSTAVCAPVWRLYERAVRRFGRVPTLIEWDADLPPLDELLAEAARAESVLEQVHELAA